ncbi:LAMI_0G12904g1_1 [Lachancea mirantina]|uniref:LAMI_0G12904g1_1 n=1 Tax=Lachancea mirantina TaxID=1230905 RepID=A0A1G4KBK6_9SACH|nr:LAMI_0G12904g1_1 [Lachancea mirantina]
MSEERKLLQKRLRPLYESILTLKEPSGLEIYPIFQVLPGRKDYPDYYGVIKHPMSLSTVKKRLNNNYRDPQEFVNDLAQITWNARTYNAKQSDIYNYAEIMDAFINDTIIDKLQKFYPGVVYPDLGPLPDDADASSRSKAAARAVHASPAAPAQPAVNVKVGVTEPALLKSEPANDNSVSTPGEADADEEEDEYEEQPQDEDEDEDYVEQKKVLPKIRIPAMTQSPAPQQPASQSMTPTPLYHRHQQQKTHMRRGRPPVIDLPYEQRIKNVLKALKKDVNDRNEPITAALDRLPDEEREPQYYNMVSNPISIDEIRKKVKQRKYKNFQSFQQDFKLSIANFQLYHRSQSTDMRRAADLERRFNDLCKYELSRPDEDFMTDGELKYPLNQVDHNGVSYKIGDWILINNPNDTTKPTIAQIFRLWYTSDGRRWLNACWYLRPEQTVHRYDRIFYKNEVVKSGQYRDHLVEEIVGKCYVCHFTRYQRGDPDVEIEGPLFVCEFRYNESEKVFNKIRTWKGCLPEEVRDVEESTIPVMGRKFFKYDSPIKHLLPPDATVTDPIPAPTEGAVNAPPLVGAVYLRPKVKKDDLGEYSTSDDCPRYIIRPGDIPEPGNINSDTGTMVVSSQASNNLPKLNASTTRLTSLNKSRSATGLSGIRHSTTASYNPPAMKTAQLLSSGPVGTPSPPPPEHNAPITAQQPITQISKASTSSIRQPAFNPPTIISSIAAQARTNPSVVGTIVTDTPGAFVLPISITKNIEVLQRSDHNSQLRRQGKDQMFKKRKNRGEIIWFKGPSVAISERLINSRNEFTDLSLNRWFKKRKLDYEEVDAEDNDYNNNDDQDYEEGEDSEDDEFSVPGTFPLGLRPSASYMAFKIQQQSEVYRS